jgi:hypothetical protein
VNSSITVSMRMPPVLGTVLHEVDHVIGPFRPAVHALYPQLVAATVPAD